MTDSLRIAVTGGAGFLGRYLLETLRLDFPDAAIAALVRREVEHPIAGVYYRQALGPVDLVFHLAGSSGIERSLTHPAEDLRDNVATTLDVLAALRRAPARLVLASSMAVYGRASGIVSEAHPLRPVSPYGVSKLAAEGYVRSDVELQGLDACVARIGSTYGPGQKRLAIYDLARRAIREPPPLSLRGTGTEVRDFVHAADVARALITIARYGIRGEAYNVGSGHAVTLGEVGALIASAAGHDATSAIQPDGQPVPGKVDVFRPSIEKLAQLGFRASVPLDRGIAATVAWVRTT